MSSVDRNLVYKQQQENGREERVAKYGFDLLDINLWKNYTCHKKVLAVPLKRGLYNAHQGWPMPEKENPEDEGYLVQYLDGGPANHPDHENYISWSPKAVFEKGYEETKGTTPKERVELELQGLELLKNTLHGLLSKPQPAFISDWQWELLKLQFTAMGNYAGILSYRLEYWDVEMPADTLEKIRTEFSTLEHPVSPVVADVKNQLRGRIANISFVDEAPFHYPNGAPMTICKTQPLENGMALGTVETLSAPNGELTFSDALAALKFGYRVQRAGWNGKDMWLSVSNLNTATVDADKFWSPHNSDYAKQNGGSAEVPPCITMKNAKGQIQMGWLPSQEDLFSSDWFVFEKQDEFSGTAGTDAHLKGIETKDQSRDNELRHQFDFDRSDFTKVYVRLANFLNDNGNEREKLEVHQHGLLEVQLNIMTLLENLINCHGADIGENGEVLTCLTLPEALMFVDAGFTVRHKTWIPGDSISKVSREGGSEIYRVGEDLPWEIPSAEVFRKNWVLLYKEV